MRLKFFGLTILTLLFTALIFLTSCGSAPTSKVSDSANAMSTIREYARTNGATTEPTIKDYNDATIRGVDNNETLMAINSVLREEEIGIEEVQTPTDIQMLLYERDILSTPPMQSVNVGSLPSTVPVATSTPTPVVTPSPTASPPANNYDHIIKDGITTNFNFAFPSNIVELSDTSLNFDPKDFKAIKKYSSGVEIDVTSEIEIKIIYEGNEVDGYDKTKIGEHGFRYSFNGKEIVTYIFYIDGNQTLTPTPVLVPSPSPTPVSSNKIVNITDIGIKLKYNENFTHGSTSRPLPVGVWLEDPGYSFINKENGKRLYIITIQTRGIKDSQGRIIGFNTKYGVSYRNRIISVNEYEGGNEGITIVDENGKDVTKYLREQLSIDSGNSGSTIGFGSPTDGYIAIPYVLNRKGEMRSNYIFNNYADERQNKTERELWAMRKVAKNPYAYVIRYVKAE